MKKFILALCLIPMVFTLIACTSNTNNGSESELEETNQEDEVHETTNKIEYEIPDENWDLSQIFEHSVEYESGEEGSYTVVGDKDTIGFTGPFPIVAKDKQKYFWFYFGNENVYDKPVEVKAIKKGEEELVDLFSGTFYKGAEVSPGSVNMPSHLRFPSVGVWKILVYIDNELYESIIVKVE